MREPDEIGPEAQLFVNDPVTGMRGLLVIDSTALGPCGGGVRMLPDLTSDEIADLARGMTYKFALLGLPRGGSKAGIWADPNLPPDRKQKMLRSFGRALSTYLASKDVAVGPDMGVSVADVASIYQGAAAENVRTGLFEQLFEGDPAAYHITGYGVVTAIRTAAPFAELDLGAATVAVEGFGQVGAGVARHVVRSGARVVAVSTIEGGLYDPSGLDVDRLLQLRRCFGDRFVHEYGAAERIAPDAIYYLPVDVLVPGARPYVIDHRNAERVRARLVVSGGNITTTSAADETLFARGIVVVPDFVANAGGAVASWVDMLGGDLQQALDAIRSLIGRSTSEVLSESARVGRSPTIVATLRARARVLAARGAPKKSFGQIREEIRAILAALPVAAPAPAASTHA